MLLDPCRRSFPFRFPWAERLALLWLLAAPAVAQSGAAAGAPTELRRRNTSPPASRVHELGDAALGGALVPGDRYGRSVAPLGDFDGDGVPDLAVSAPGDAAGGAVWLLFLRSNGSVKGARELTPAACGCAGSFLSVDRLGDLDGDGVTELLVGAVEEAYVVFLQADGSARGSTRIAAGAGGFAGTPPAGFGASVTRLGDLDGDGTPDAAVGSLLGVELLFLGSDGRVRSQQELRPGLSGFPDATPIFPGRSGLAFFGLALDELGDFDHDGVQDLLVTGEEAVFEGQIGRLWLVLLRPDGTVKAVVEHDAASLGLWPDQGGCGGWNSDGGFGYGAAVVGDLDRDGVRDLAVGAPYHAAGCCEWKPAVRLLALESSGDVKSITTISDGSAPYGLALESLDGFGFGLASPGDVDGDGRRDLVIGAPGRHGTPDEFCDSALGAVGTLWLLVQRP